DDIHSVAEKAIAKGQENEVHITKDGKKVIKVNNLSLLDAEHDFDSFIDRLQSHNELFGKEVPYKIIGFTKNSTGEVSVVLEQPYLPYSPAMQQEIDSYLQSQGFRKTIISDGEEGWTNDKYELWDTDPRNVLVDKNGNLYFIDTVVNSVNKESETTESISEEIKFQIVEDINESEESAEKAKDDYLNASQETKDAKSINDLTDAFIKEIVSQMEYGEKSQERFDKLDAAGELVLQERFVPLGGYNGYDDLLTNNFITSFVDEDSPLFRLQKLVKKLGGKVRDASNMYEDKNHSYGRATTAITKFKKEQMLPMLDSIRAIIKSHRLETFRPKWERIDLEHLDLPKKAKEKLKKRSGTDLTDIEKVEVYLQGKDIIEAEELGLAGRGRKGFEKEVGMTVEEYISGFERFVNKEQLTTLHQKVKAATQFSLDVLHNSGLIDRERYEKYSARKHYVPERGWIERDMFGRETNFVKGYGMLNNNPYNAALVKAKGRSSLASSPLMYIESIGISSVMSAEKNRTKIAALNFVMENERMGKEKNLFGLSRVWYVEEDETEETEGTEGKKGKKVKIYKEVYNRPSQELFDAGKVKNEVHRNYKRQVTKAEAQQREVVAFVNGEKYVMWFSQEAVSNSLNHVMNKRNMSAAEKGIKKATKRLTSLMTQYNPAFAGWNFFRDAQNAIFSNMTMKDNPGNIAFLGKLGNSKMHAALWRHIIKGHTDTGSGKYDQRVKDFFEDGAQTGYSYLKDIEQLKTDIDKEIKRNAGYYIGESFDKFAKCFSVLTEWSELSVRFAEYNAMIDKGYSRFQATTAAKNVSVNFNRRGSVRFLGSFFGFWNAQIQGSRKLFNIISSGVGIGIASTHLVGGFLNTVLFPDDDDEKRRWGEYDRMQNICIGDFKLPLAQGMRLFWAIGVQAGLAVNGAKETGEAILDAVKYTQQELLPIDFLTGLEYDENTSGGLTINGKKILYGFVPTSLAPIYEVGVNMRFTGSKIHPEPFTLSLEETTPKTFLGSKTVNPLLQQFTDFMLEVGGGDRNLKTIYRADGKKISGVYNLNPSNIEHLIKGYIPGVGTTILELITTVSNAMEGEFDPSTVPILNRSYKPYNEEISKNKEKYETIDKEIKPYESRKSAIKQSLKEAAENKDRQAIQKYRNKLREHNKQSTEYQKAKRKTKETPSSK
ncbi:MAG: hypothetical protein LBE13_07825, partial [Bacteroidales bacterium]|nr:hypothetical protein [Bacteroidales bacterium]